MKTPKNKQIWMAQGQRLKHLMDIRGITSQAELCRMIQEQEHFELSRSSLNQYIKGTRGISEQNIISFSKVLNADDRFLRGADGFRYPSYEVFESVLSSNNELVELKADIQYEARYLKQYEISICSVNRRQGNIASYTLLLDNKHYQVEAEQLNSFNDSIDKYISDCLVNLLGTVPIQEGEIAND